MKNTVHFTDMQKGCLVDFPDDTWEIHLTRKSARLVQGKKCFHEELFINPSMQYLAIQNIRCVIENIKAGRLETKEGVPEAVKKFPLRLRPVRNHEPFDGDDAA